MARIFNTPAAGLAGLAVQARAYLSEHEVEFADSEGEERLDFSHMGAVLAHGILTLADPWPAKAGSDADEGYVNAANIDALGRSERRTPLKLASAMAFRTVPSDRIRFTNSARILSATAV